MRLKAVNTGRHNPNPPDQSNGKAVSMKVGRLEFLEIISWRKDRDEK